MIKWVSGRQNPSYQKFRVLQWSWPIGFDCYLLRFKEGAELKPHIDPVTDKKHYRLNIIMKMAKSGGEFECGDKAIINTKRIKLFRPDICLHGVSRVNDGTRYVLSLGVAF